MSSMCRFRSVRVATLLAACVVAAGVGSANGQETKINRPQLKSGGANSGYSSKPAEIVPLLTRSLANMRQAQAIVTSAQSEQQYNEAAELVEQAYRMQRAAHGGIAIIERGHQSKKSTTPAATLISQEWAIIDASRKNLLMAHFRFEHARMTEATRIRSGLEYLQAAIQQTEMALAIH